MSVAGGNGAKQMSDIIAYLKSHNLRVAEEGEDVIIQGNDTVLAAPSDNLQAKVGMLWIDVEGTSYWSSSTSNNVAFIQDMVNEAARQKVSIGIYSRYDHNVFIPQHDHSPT